MSTLKNPELLFKQRCFINGAWVGAKQDKTVDVTNPADGSLIGTIPDCDAKDVACAIDAAHVAWPAWRGLSAKERADILWRWADLIREHTDDLAYLMTLEQGKPLEESKGEISYGNSFIEWFAEEGRRVYGDIIPSNKAHQRLLVIKQSVGVVASITPWNFPNAMITRKCAPALAAGCPVVIRPSELTPYSALALAALAEKAGFPKGVVNVITGDAKVIGAELTSNPLVRKVSFTGSTGVGKTLMAQSATTLKKLSLELGGNAPFIVFDDANMKAAVVGAVASKFRNGGQTCVCVNRFLVHETCYQDFADRLVVEVKKLKVGNGMDKGVQIGPMISTAAVKKIQEHIDDAVSKGATILCGGKPHALGGTFFEPTVLINVTASMQIAKEETFGPIAALFRFKNEEEAIAMANDTEFGLASYFYSDNIHRVWRVSEALEYGIVGVNEGLISTEVAPFGGVKESGMGREGSKYGIEDYLEIKYICMSDITH